MREGVEMTEYKEDSTKGNSLIQPLNYKGDVLTQTWVDSRVLATLTYWMESVGFYPKTLSDVARRPLELLMEMLVTEGKVGIIDDTNQARELLSRRFRVNLNRGGRGGKNILHNQVLSDMRSDLAENLLRQKERDDVSRPNTKHVVSPENMEEMVRLMSSSQTIAPIVDYHTQLMIQLTEDDILKIANPPMMKAEYEVKYSSLSEENKKKSDQYIMKYLDKKIRNKSGAELIKQEKESQLEHNNRLQEFINSRTPVGKNDTLDEIGQRILEKDKKEMDKWDNLDLSIVKVVEDK